MSYSLKLGDLMKALEGLLVVGGGEVMEGFDTVEDSIELTLTQAAQLLHGCHEVRVQVRNDIDRLELELTKRLALLEKYLEYKI